MDGYSIPQLLEQEHIEAEENAEADLRMFWNFHMAYASARSDEAADKANEYKARIEDTAFGEIEFVPASRADEDHALSSIGAKQV